MKKLVRKIKYTIVLLCLFILGSCSAFDNNKEKLYVYNWGIYIDKSTIENFEKKYNVDVIYDEFDTNEEMYIIV